MDRSEERELTRSVQRVFWRVFLTAVVAAVVIGAVGFGLNALGVIGGTAVERKVFENSYQRSEAIRAQIANDRAVLAEIERKLANPKLDPEVRQNLEAQAAAARIRIRTAKGRMER